MAGKTIAYLNVLIGADSRKLQAALDTTEKSVKRFGGKLEYIGSDLSMKVTAPLMAIGAASVSVASTFSDSMLKVKALSGATGEEFLQLENKAKQLGQSTRYSASETADAMGFMALAGFETNQILEATPAILSLAAASMTDLATTSDIVTDTMSAFKIEAKDASKVSDLFAQTQAKSNTSVLQLGEAFKYVAPNFAAAGQSIEDTSSMLAVLANSGFKGSMAGTALNAMLKDLTTKSKNGAIAIGETSIAVYKANGEMRSAIDIIADLEKATAGMTQQQKDAALAALFEERSIKAVNIMLNQGSEELRRYQNLMSISEGIAKKLADIMESGLGGALREIYSNIEGVAIIIGQHLTPSIKSLGEWVKKVTNWFSSLEPETQKNIVKFGMFAASVGPVLFGLGKMITISIGLIAKLKALAIAAGVSKVALAGIAGPIGLIAAAIAIAIPSLIELNNELVKTKKIKGEVKKAQLEENFKMIRKEVDFLAASFKKIDPNLTETEALTRAIDKQIETYKNLYATKLKAGNLDADKLNQEIKFLLNWKKEVTKITKEIAEPEGGSVGGGFVENLKTRLSSLNEELKKISVSSDVLGKNFDHLQARTSAFSSAMIELRLKGLDPLSEKYIELKKQYNKAFDSQKVIEMSKNLSELVKRPYIIDLKINGVKDSFNIKGMGFEGFDKIADNLAKNIFEKNMAIASAAKQGYDRMIKDHQQFAQNYKQSWNMAIAGFATDALVGFADAIGRFAVNGKSAVENMGSQILGSFGKFLSKMGAMAISYGVMQKVISMGWNPVGTIAAGMALVAIGGAMTAMAGKAQSAMSGGGSGGGAMSGNYNSSFFQNRGFTDQKQEVTFTVKGDQLVGVLDNYNRFKRRF